jgi:hypothetical protein
MDKTSFPRPEGIEPSPKEEGHMLVSNTEPRAPHTTLAEEQE